MPSTRLHSLYSLGLICLKSFFKALTKLNNLDQIDTGFQLMPHSQSNLEL